MRWYRLWDVLEKSDDANQAAASARKGAEDTKVMKASLGRAVYVGAEEEWMGMVPDPGAWS
jgi:triose/dihydroxyacetone kinase / FAD-AMP lyase (cyclizing)